MKYLVVVIAMMVVGSWSRSIVKEELGYMGASGHQCHLNVVSQPLHQMVNDDLGLRLEHVPSYIVESQLANPQNLLKRDSSYVEQVAYDPSSYSLMDTQGLIPGGLATQVFEYNDDHTVDTELCCCAPFYQVFCGGFLPFNWQLATTYYNGSLQEFLSFFGNQDITELLGCDPVDEFCQCLVTEETVDFCDCCGLQGEFGTMCATCIEGRNREAINYLSSQCYEGLRDVVNWRGKRTGKRGFGEIEETFHATFCTCPEVWEGPLSLLVSSPYQQWAPWLPATPLDAALL